MPQADDQRYFRTGTRIRVYPQSPVLASVGEPETIWISPRAGTVGPGPGDDRMYVVDPLYPKAPYEIPARPPYRGPIRPPVRPDTDGHFDYLAPGTREFRAAHAYGVLRRVLDIWQGYFGRAIPWHFRDRYAFLEVVPSLEWDNAHSGYGFIEAGVEVSDAGVFQHYAENFDVLSHELGHSIIFSEVGVPDREQLTAEFLGLNESLSDMVALVSVLHFDSVVNRLLDHTRGNLYTLNELNRIAEESESEQIRIASNGLKMSDVADAWSELPESCDEHRLGQPVTGALFDILVDIFLDNVQAQGLAPAWLADASRAAPDEGIDYALIQREFDTAYERDPQAFKLALLNARDYLGFSLAASFQQLDPLILGFGELYSAMLIADETLTRGRNQDAIRECFEWREIHPQPIDGQRLENIPRRRTRQSNGTWVAPIIEVQGLRRHLPYIERVRKLRGHE